MPTMYVERIVFEPVDHSNLPVQKQNTYKESFFKQRSTRQQATRQTNRYYEHPNLVMR